MIEQIKTFLISVNYYCRCPDSREHQSDWQDAFLKPELSADIVKNGDLDETDPELMMLSPEGDNVLSCGALTAMLMTFARFIRY